MLPESGKKKSFESACGVKQQKPWPDPLHLHDPSSLDDLGQEMGLQNPGLLLARHEDRWKPRVVPQPVEKAPVPPQKEHPSPSGSPTMPMMSHSSYS
jgi:hypothetical protein